MLKTWVNRWRNRGKPPTRLDPVIIPRDQHPISRRQISSVAVKTLYRLHDAGYQAFLIGGGVRDLLIGIMPKDFDIATDATPEEVKALFGNQCQVIGRRFRLAHVRWGREIIEVATFRANHDEAASHQGGINDDGLIIRDNVWGCIEEDAARRDFTINAIYYNIADFSLWDFANGSADIENRIIRMIGDPELRYREDPVRMLRAIRFAAKLDFDIEQRTAHPIPMLAELLSDISPHRMYDECQKLLSAGYATYVLPLLQDYGLFETLFPQAAKFPCQQLWMLTARNTDQRIADDKNIHPAFFIAALLWGDVQNHFNTLVASGMPHVPAWQKASQMSLSRQHTRTAIPRHIGQVAREIWELQERLQTPRPRQVELLAQNPRFRAAYDFLLLREQAGEATNDMATWWTRWQSADPGLQAEMVRSLTDVGGKGKRPRRKRTAKVSPQ